MVMPRNETQSDAIQSWQTYLTALDTALGKLAHDIEEAAQMASVCTREWCEATEHVIDELNNSLFSISEPRWSMPEDSRRIKALKKSIHDLYSDYRNVYRQVA